MHSSSRLALLLLMSILLVLLLPTQPTYGCGTSYSEAQLSSDLRELAQKVEMLWSGTDAERAWIAAAPAPQFAPFDSIEANESPEQVEILVASLRWWMELETDDYLVSSVVDALRRFENPALEPLFVDGLHHHSINVRAAAVRFFVSVRRPQTIRRLETIWLEDTMPGMRVNTMLALACQGSDRFGRAFLSGLDSPHPRSAAAAAGAVGQLRLKGALPRLIRALDADDPIVQRSAAQQLGRWPESERAGIALTKVLDNKDVQVRIGALAALRNFADSPEITASIRQRALIEENDWIRSLAFTALAQRTGRSRSRLLDALRSDASFRFDFEPRYAVGNRIAQQELPLQRSGRDSCSLRPLDGDPTVGPFAQVVAKKGSRSTRCYEQPGVASDPLIANRVRSDTPTKLQRFFIRDGVTWRLSVSRGLCWLPEETLRFQETWARPKKEAIPPFEYDLPIADLDDPQLQSLLEQESLVLFDLANDAAGVRLLVDLADRGAVQRWVDAWRASETLLGFRMTEAIDLLKKQYPNHAAWEETEGVRERHQSRHHEVWRRTERSRLNAR